MGSHDPFGYLKHKLWPVKVKNCYAFLACRWHATYRWKVLDKGYNFALDLTSIGGLHTKLQASKVVKVSILGISGLPLGSLGQNDIWVLTLWPSTKYTIRGKVVASPKFGLCWVLWVHVCSWLVHAPKVFQLHIN
jgi:hypothetical protein